MKTLYGIGTGPGDEDLLTLRAVRSIEKSDVIFAPNNKGRNMALDTAKRYLKDKKIILLDFPMGNVRDDDYKKASMIIEENIPENGRGSFLTIGDPMIYSTFIYIMEKLNKDKIKIDIVPGIPSFVAAAAAAQMPLTVKGDDFILCDELEEETLKRTNSLAILKTYKNKERILDKLEGNDFKYRYVKKVSLKEELVLESREEILKDKNYISLILARKND
ncbi:MAG: precorrin-2 C(20)-methyltransferase [Tissierella sp.]|uniref:precorrin-2 C(20)-methyltransferase n=1 Tax=Tissierella sp. TaxID=41274 RepID=UPI003F983342